jgi:dolichol-phosphate mannosyltransferase
MTSEQSTEIGSTGKQQAPLAVLMPVCDAAAEIEAAVSEVCREVLERVPGSYLIVVDDGSKDKTGEILDSLSETDPRIRVIHKPNTGNGPSLIRALNEAESDFVLIIDSDRQVSLSVFGSLWEIATAPGNDGVFCIRSSGQDDKLQRFLSRLIVAMLSVTFRVRLADTTVPCKILRRKIWTELYDCIQDDTLLAPALAIAIYARRHGYKIVDAKVSQREKNSSELDMVKLIRFCLQSFRQTMNLRDRIL